MWLRSGRACRGEAMTQETELTTGSQYWFSLTAHSHNQLLWCVCATVRYTLLHEQPHSSPNAALQAHIAAARPPQQSQSLTHTHFVGSPYRIRHVCSQQRRLPISPPRTHTHGHPATYAICMIQVVLPGTYRPTFQILVESPPSARCGPCRRRRRRRRR